MSKKNPRHRKRRAGLQCWPSLLSPLPGCMRTPARTIALEICPRSHEALAGNLGRSNTGTTSRFPPSPLVKHVTDSAGAMSRSHKVDQRLARQLRYGPCTTQQSALVHGEVPVPFPTPPPSPIEQLPLAPPRVCDRHISCPDRWTDHLVPDFCSRKSRCPPHAAAFGPGREGAQTIFSLLASANVRFSSTFTRSA